MPTKAAEALRATIAVAKAGCWEGGAMALLDEKNLAAEAAKRALVQSHRMTCSLLSFAQRGAPSFAVFV
jgi:hypothetical protein